MTGRINLATHKFLLIIELVSLNLIRGMWLVDWALEVLLTKFWVCENSSILQIVSRKMTRDHLVIFSLKLINLISMILVLIYYD